MIFKHRNHSWSLVVTRGHSWSLVVTRGHSWSLVVTRGHSWSLVVTHGLSWSLVVTRGHSCVLLDKILLYTQKSNNHMYTYTCKEVYTHRHLNLGISRGGFLLVCSLLLNWNWTRINVNVSVETSITTHASTSYMPVSPKILTTITCLVSFSHVITKSVTNSDFILLISHWPKFSQTKGTNWRVLIDAKFKSQI
jgi:hypothetical protein